MTKSIERQTKQRDKGIAGRLSLILAAVAVVLGAALASPDVALAQDSGQFVSTGLEETPPFDGAAGSQARQREGKRPDQPGTIRLACPANCRRSCRAAFRRCLANNSRRTCQRQRSACLRSCGC